MDTNTPSTLNPNQESNMDSSSHIKALFDAFLQAGGEPKVTAFKKHIDGLIKSDIKQLCSGSGKIASGGTDWRREQKAMFAGRGAKWVRVALDVVMPRLDEFAEVGIDVTAYKSWIEQEGSAWVRYSGPRVNGSIRYAAFEVRTDGSTIDHPKQLLLLPEVGLSDVISPLEGTPHSMKLEVIATPVATQDDAVEADPEPIEVKVEKADPVVDEVTTLSEVPDSNDPEVWNAYLAEEGLVNPEFEDDYDDGLNDDMF